MDVKYLSFDEVQTIRDRLSKSRYGGRDFGSNRPIRPNELASAVERQHAGFGNQLKFSEPIEVAATLFYGLTLSHGYENGNKRTAIVCLLVFLQRNKLMPVDVSEDDLYELTTSVASHTFQTRPSGSRTPDSEVLGIISWLNRNIRSLMLGDRSMKFRDLREILIELGCTFDNPRSNFIKIRRITPSGELTCRTGYPRANFTIPFIEVKRIRNHLKLDEVNGFDSAAFYNLDAAVDGFANKYRNLLDRLSET